MTPPTAPGLTIDLVRLGIRQQESGGDYTVPNFNNTSHGAYQFTVPVWHSWARLLGDGEADRYAKASDAPPAVQDRMARNALQYIWDNNPRIGHDWERLIASWLTGEGSAANPSIAEQPKSTWTQIPGASGTNPSVRDYVNQVLEHIKEISK